MRKEKHPGGRPSRYKPEYAEQARRLCLLGQTDKQVADFFEITEATLNNWKKAHPEFFESLKAGKKFSDAQVAHSLFNRALGSEWTEEQAVKVKEVTYKDGKRAREEEKVVKVQVKRYTPADTTACIFWLKNRGNGWKDKYEHATDPGNPFQIEFGGMEIVQKILGKVKAVEPE